MPLQVQSWTAAPFAVEPRQRFTSPPARYSEASLIKTLESEGIGRPSTYASIIGVIQERRYVEQYLQVHGDFPANLCVRVSSPILGGVVHNFPRQNLFV